ncbi:hypothetical protein BJY04DRAFT_230133 [Aspergillus karnatakaensis]|uniref:uncharacterized protein n=1 Tax=Aspergillus karnatakaensis TaxID=1810916 RepID=UPI003CCDE379
MASWRIKAAEQMLLPAVINDLAQREPETLWAQYPSSSTTFNDGFKGITYAQFTNAVNACAHFITKALGRASTGEPLAWLAPNDPRCSIMIIAAMKAGFKLFLISERNSVAANYKLFDDVDCSTIITTALSFLPVLETLSERELIVLELPPLEQLLNEPQPEYPFYSDYSTLCRETALIVHTSGTTGFPKPIYITHEFLSKTIKNLGISAPKGYITQTSLIANKRCVLLLPLGHPAGVTFGILLAFFANTTIILPLPSVPPTGEALVSMLTHTLSKDMSLFNIIAANLEMLVFSGGSLPKVFGDVIATRIRLLSFLGSSETGPLQAIYSREYDFEHDWNYLQFPPELGANFESCPDGTHELVFKRTPETEPYQAVFASYPNLTEFRTKDLFAKHPAISGIWTHATRSDDVIVFLNGEKVNPIDFESHIARHSAVATALMFGQQRFEAGLLIELTDQTRLSVSDRARVIQQLCSTVEEANKMLPGYAQVSETHICFTEPGMPILRTLKNTIRRSATLELYKDKIEQVYADAEQMWAGGSVRPGLASVEAVQLLVRQAIRETTKIGEIGFTDDFFQRGMDSLQVLRLVRHLRQQASFNSITPSMIYLNASIGALTQSLHQLVHNVELTQQERKQNQVKARAQILQKYSAEIDTLSLPSVHTTASDSGDKTSKTIILTGSTGTIGSYILQILMKRSDVSHVYCLNRFQDSKALQIPRNAQQDPSLPQHFPKSKISFFAADLTCPSLGLPRGVYQTLKFKTTHLIHNAWPVDFNLPLQSFTPQLQGIVNLMSFCGTSTNIANLIFISSISAVMNYPTITSYPDTPIPESIIPDIEAPADAGYAESKYIAERLIDHASTKLGLRSTILRLDQVAGPAKSTGRWNRNDWVPALVRGSRELGIIPDSLGLGSEGGDIDWLPIDTAAEVIVEIGLDTSPNIDSESCAAGKRQSSTRVFNLMNPHRTTWQALLPSIINALEEHESKGVVDTVSPEVWLAKLRTAARQLLASGSSESRKEILRVNPALKLIDFFSDRFDGSSQGRGQGIWDIKRAEENSERLRSAEQIEGDMMARWVKQWLDS